MGLHQTKKLYHTEGTINKAKKKKKLPTKQQKVFANDISDKGLISTVQRTHTTQQQKANPDFKKGRGFEGTCKHDLHHFLHQENANQKHYNEISPHNSQR